MKFLEIYNRKSKVSGFTLLELTLVVALMFMVGAFVSPIGISFYRSQLLNDSVESLVGSLRQAQAFSLTGKNNHSFGIYIQTDSYTLFEGDTYSTRLISEDVVFPIIPAISMSGLSEIVFTKLTGEPNVFGEIIVASETREKQIEILTSGNIN